MYYLGVLGSNFENTMALFDFIALDCVLLQSLVQKKRSFSLGPKMSYLGIFGLELKFILSYLKSLPSNLSYCQIV